MNALTRKQREIAARHALFLDLGRRLIESEGYATLSMDKIAELAEYSKGTVYQHFACKEELLIQLCNVNSLQLKEMFKRAVDFPGNTREKLMAIFVANSLWSKIDPSCMEMMQTLHSPAVKEKVTEESLEKHEALEQAIIGLVAGIVESAVAEKELLLPESLNPYELVFGMWSICHGGLQLQALNMPLQEMGIRKPNMALLGVGTAALDGLGWQPLSTKFDYDATLTRILEDCFSDEVKQTGFTFN